MSDTVEQALKPVADLGIDVVTGGLSLEGMSQDGARFYDAHSEVKAVNEDTREVLHLISTGSRDRQGDVVEPMGVNLKNYRRNPIVLANHRYDIESIIGRSTMVEPADDGIYARTKFLETPLAETAFRVTAARLGGWSVGFRPMPKSHTVKAGVDAGCKKCEELAKDKGSREWHMHFTAWEMLEYSSVAIPANQDVVNHAVQRGLVPEAMVPLFFQIEQVEQKEAEPAPAAPDRANVRQPMFDRAAVEKVAAPYLGRIDRIFAREHAAREVARITRELCPKT